MKVPKKRKRKFKTDYKKRINLLKSEKPRVVFRKTNRYFIAQYVISEEAKDKIHFGRTSKQLLKFGWPEKLKGSLKSLPAAYLFGFSFGKEIAQKKLEEPILDFGMIRVLHKTKVYAFLKGLKDAGIPVKYNEENVPEIERIKGDCLKNKINFEEIKSKIEK